MIKELVEGLIVAFGMYSRIPVPKISWTKKNMQYAIAFFPMVGICVGALSFGWIYLCKGLPVSDLIKGAIAAAIPLLVTGGIHFDGFLDTIDAKMSYKPREQKLEILKDPHIGAFGVIAAVLYLLLYTAGSASVEVADAGILALGFVLSRVLSAIAVMCFPNARGSGSLYGFSEAAQRRISLIWLVCLLGLTVGGMLWWNPIKAGFALLAAVLCFGHYWNMSKRIFGGITGDLAGYFVQICEITMLAGVVISQWM